MRQLDVDVSPPAFVNPYLVLAIMALDLHPCEFWPWLLRPLSNKHCKVLEITFLTWRPWIWPMTFAQDLDSTHIHYHTIFGDPKSNGSRDMIFPSNFGLVTTDRKWSIWAHHASTQKGTKMFTLLPRCVFHDAFVPLKSLRHVMSRHNVIQCCQIESVLLTTKVNSAPPNLKSD